MSKKGKRLEKENEALKRQKEATAANIIRMAEERQEWKKKLDAAEKKIDKLMSIIQQMQQQGRKVPPGLASTIESCYTNDEGGDNGEGEGDESDYSDEGEEEGLSEFDDDTEEEAQPTEHQQQQQQQGQTVLFGPERPPQPQPSSQVELQAPSQPQTEAQPQPQPATNGH